MWVRKELKARGKIAFQSNYWRCVLVAFVLLVVIGAGGGGGGRAASNANDAQNDSEQKSQVAAMVGLSAGALSVLGILVFGPAEVGCRRFFLVNSDEPAELREMGFGFRNNYGNVLLTMLLRNIFLFLWGLLFVVPIFIKVYSYRLVPYILAEDPDMPPKEAITLSRKLMDGQKWNTFVLDLSFFGWGLLSLVTAGIVGIFYVSPYTAATDAELYKAIRGRNAAPAGEWNDGIAE